MPGDSYSDLAWRTTVEWESLDPILVPVWVLAVRYRDDKPPLRVVINGQTGKIAGKVPLSWWKVTLAIVVALAVIAAIDVLVTRHERGAARRGAPAACTRCATPLEDGDLRCAICALPGAGRAGGRATRKAHAQVLRCVECGAAVAFSARGSRRRAARSAARR